MSLEDKLEMGIFNGITKHLNKKGREKQEGEISEKGKSRRNFIKKGLIGAATIASGTLLSKPARAFYIRDLPPGIQLLNNVDDELMFAFAEMYFDTRMERVMEILEYKCKKETPLIQPVYWITAEIYRLKPEGRDIYGYLHKQLKLIEGTNMENWFKGLNNYYGAWINEKYARKNNDYLKTEELAKKYFAKTYTRACTENTLGKKGEENADEFIKRIENQNYDSFIVALNNNLKKQDYNQKLLASWSLLFLSINYAQRTRSKTKNYNFIRDKLESSISSFVPRVRGPPLYRYVF